MSKVTWVITSEQKDGKHFIDAGSHKEMIDALIGKGFKRALGENIPYQIPPLQPECMEDLYYEESDVTLHAEEYYQHSQCVHNLPMASIMVDAIKKLI